MFNNLYKKIPFALLLLVAATGCKKMDLAPTDRYTELTFWKSGANVNNALNNIYSRLYTSGLFFYDEALSDNAYTRLGISSGFQDQIASGNFTPTLSRFENDWGYYYTGIKAENIFLENADQTAEIETAVKERMKAEVRFIRAFHYFKLMNKWGDVPLLVTDPTPDEAKEVSRTPKADVLQFILSELDAVAAILPANTQYATGDRGRITRGAAIALKARVLLYEGNRMAEVVTACEQLMADQAVNGTYSLFPSYTGIFSPANEYNSEVVLDLQYVPSVRTWGEHIDFVPISAGARGNNMAPTQELVNSYVMLNGKPITDAGSGYSAATPYAGRDPRLDATIVYDRGTFTGADGVARTIYIKPGTDPNPAAPDEYKPSGQGTATGYYWKKYYDPTAVAGFNSGLNLIMIRWAEVLLMYAEAKQSLGQMNADVWNVTVRPIRQRAGFTDPGALEFPATGDLTEIIRNERRAEFAMEGLRIDDIRRWGIAETVMNGWAHGAQFEDPSVDNGFIRAQLRTFDPARHYLWPVPQRERELNTNLTQNPGW
ncbi:MAG: RagB/SusD family nutrient uptake outer membrane protein [Chitinophagaceae bacterium]|nr:MAG: RagB/SusD family nutrient uptake outer membrane protein [Chitinophagaceae bacterium]